MSISDIQPVNDSQSNWDIKAALKAVYKPALAAASIGIALAATASYFLASANEETAIEATNYAMVPLPSSGAVSTVQDVGTAGMALLHGLTGLAVAAWVNKTNQNASEQNGVGLAALDIPFNMPITTVRMITAEPISVCITPTATHQMTGAELIKEIEILCNTGRESEILPLLQHEVVETLTNEEKIEILSHLSGKFYAPDFTTRIIERLDPIFTDPDFAWFHDLHAYENPPLFRAICERYQVTHTKIAHDFIYQEIAGLQHFKNNPHFYKLSKETTLIFIEIHGRSILNSRNFFDRIKQSETSLDLEFFKSLHRLGWKSRFFNLPINKDEQTLIHKFFRAGDVHFIRKLAKDIPMESMDLGDHLFLEELKDCFATYPIEGTKIRQEGNILAQNGCRSIVFTKDGKVLAIPGLDVKTLLPAESQPTVTVYLNEGHASIAFADGSHYGFYPKGEDILNGSSGSSSWKSSAASTPKKPLPLVTGIFSGSGASPLLSVNCEVIPDSEQKTFSETHNQLKLDIYASEDQVVAMKEYIKETEKKCRNAQEFYHVFSHNCINFVQDVVGSAGLKADVRNAFSSLEFLRRPGLANLYTIPRSHGPTLLSSESFPVNTETLIQGMIPLTAASALYLSTYAVRKIAQGTLFVMSYLYRKVRRQ